MSVYWLLVDINMHWAPLIPDQTIKILINDKTRGYDVKYIKIANY